MNKERLGLFLLLGIAPFFNLYHGELPAKELPSNPERKEAADAYYQRRAAEKRERKAKKKDVILKVGNVYFQLSFEPLQSHKGFHPMKPKN